MEDLDYYSGSFLNPTGWIGVDLFVDGYFVWLVEITQPFICNLVLL